VTRGGGPGLGSREPRVGGEPRGPAAVDRRAVALPPPGVDLGAEQMGLGRPGGKPHGLVALGHSPVEISLEQVGLAAADHEREPAAELVGDREPVSPDPRSLQDFREIGQRLLMASPQNPLGLRDQGPAVVNPEPRFLSRPSEFPRPF
jgi:hypothetical protein